MEISATHPSLFIFQWNYFPDSWSPPFCLFFLRSFVFRFLQVLAFFSLKLRPAIVPRWLAVGRGGPSVGRLEGPRRRCLHDLLTNLADLQLQTQLGGEYVRVACLEGSRGLSCRDETEKRRTMFDQSIKFIWIGHFRNTTVQNKTKLRFNCFHQDRDWIYLKERSRVLEKVAWPARDVGPVSSAETSTEPCPGLPGGRRLPDLLEQKATSQNGSYIISLQKDKIQSY